MVSYRMNRKHRNTLATVFEDPVRSNVRWDDVMSLFDALGCAIASGRGSRVCVSLNGADAVFHTPHRPDTDKGALRAVRDFLREAGVKP
jgi:hypothetical protein